MRGRARIESNTGLRIYNLWHNLRELKTLQLLVMRKSTTELQADLLWQEEFLRSRQLKALTVSLPARICVRRTYLQIGKE